jgi:hypothetical protein
MKPVQNEHKVHVHTLPLKSKVDPTLCAHMNKIKIFLKSNVEPSQVAIVELIFLSSGW